MPSILHTLPNPEIFLATFCLTACCCCSSTRSNPATNSYHILSCCACCVKQSMTDDLSQRLKWFSLISLTQYDDAREPQTLCAVKQPEHDASDSLNRFRSASACSTVSFASASSWCSNTSNEGAFGSPGSKKSRRKRIRRRRRSSSGSASGVMGLKVIGIGDKVAGYAYDSQLMDHKDPRGQHPECPGRLKKIVTTLKDAGLLSKCLRVPCRNASKQELQSVHTATYISKMRTMERKKDKSVNDLVNFASEVSTN